jgi:hypothetical protein
LGLNDASEFSFAAEGHGVKCCRYDISVEKELVFEMKAVLKTLRAP